MTSAIERLTHAELAVLGRELLLAGHLIDRAGMPNLMGRFGVEVMRDVAIDEWMGASPVYTRRMQALLGFGGDSVETIFKGMQFDVGAPPQFMDFRYTVHDHDHGEFWLDHCGALMDVEPMGEELVVTMCHAIEDPTFPATACATNPRAVVLPLHRPPRTPSDRHPHCHWTVDVDPDREPVVEPAVAEWVASTLAAAMPVASIAPATASPTDADRAGGPSGAGARTAYDGPVDSDLRLEEFTVGALHAICDEACMQGHLLVLSFLHAIDEREGADAALELGRKQFIGIAGVAAMRLHRAFGRGAGHELGDIATVLDLHPAFRPRAYVDLDVSLDEAGERVLVELGDCPAVAEPSGFTWAAMLTAGEGATSALDAIVTAVDPTARCQPVAPRPGRRWAWEVTLGHAPAGEPSEVTLTKFSTGADFVFR